MRRPASHRPNLAHLVRSPLRGVAAFALASTALAQSAAPGVQHHRAPRIVAHTVVEGLEHPWAVAFLPDGRYLISERPGRLRVATPEGRLLAPITGLPAIASGGQGGLLDVLCVIVFGDAGEFAHLFLTAASASSADCCSAIRRLGPRPSVRTPSLGISQATSNSCAWASPITCTIE